VPDHGAAPGAADDGALGVVPTPDLSLARFDGVLSPDAVERLHRYLDAARPLFAGRTVWNVNSTARGGGVAEMLAALVPYARGAGVDARWLVVNGDEKFFALTKRIHNRLHGAAGDGGPLGEDERRAYDTAIAPAARELARRIGPRDVVILHDPQTAGLIPHVRSLGVPVVWRAHIGVDDPDDVVRSAWRFLQPYVSNADVCVFSRRPYMWDGIDPGRCVFISPSIDPFAAKNQDLGQDAARAILAAAGLTAGPAPRAAPAFTRADGTIGEVARHAVVDRSRDLDGRPFVLQVSRWDALKDPLGVIEGFVRHVAPATDADLVYAGPAVDAVADDPEGAGVLERVRAYRATLPEAIAERIHLAMLPMDDLEENAAIVNALQTNAAVVVQKSLAEGFGLTVAEAMWKARPVVASAVGGIVDQIEADRSGLLLADPTDGEAYGEAVLRLLNDASLASRIGVAARERVRERFLSDRSLIDYLDLISPLIGGSGDIRNPDAERP
jgi:trehalose synthase